MTTNASTGEGLVFSSFDSLLSQQQSARLLQQTTRYRKATKQAGNHQVRQLGRGMEFAESRPYSPGDDIRSIDWKITARTGEAHTKLYEEERERPVMLWCDLRPSMFFATQGQFKSVVMTEVASLLAWKSWLDGDKVGGVLRCFDSEKQVRPARSKSKVLQLVKELAGASQLTPDFSEQGEVSLAKSWERLRRVLAPGSQVILLSDFRGIDEEAEQQLRRISKRSAITLVSISDPFEHQLPSQTHLRLSDGLRFLRLDTAKNTLVEKYEKNDQTHSERIIKLALQCRARLIEISTAESEQLRIAKLRGAIV